MTFSEERINIRYNVFGVGDFSLQDFERTVKIFVVLIGLVLIFKKQLTTIVNNIFKTISTESGKV